MVTADSGTFGGKESIVGVSKYEQTRVENIDNENDDSLET